jgi:hypothetical protein
MTFDELKLAANEIALPPPQAAAEFCEKCDLLAARVSERLNERTDLDRLVGSGNREMMEDNHRNQAKLLGATLTAFSPGGFVATLLWAMTTYRRRGFQPAYWEAQSHAWREVMREELTEDTYYQVLPLLEWVQAHTGEFWQLSTIHIENQTTVTP